jgi:hypothetical protein
MNRLKDGANDVERGGKETALRFVMTLIVSTLMAATTAYALSYATLAPARHAATAAAQHERL